MSATNGSASAEAEGMSPTVQEMLVPPLALLAGICASLLIWLFLLQCRSKRKPSLPKFVYGDTDTKNRLKSNSINPTNSLFQNTFKTNESHIHISKNNINNNSSSVKSSVFSNCNDGPLFQTSDEEIIAYLQGQGPIKFWPFMDIVTPVILSLGFCPLTLLLSEPIAEGLWPSDQYKAKPNINDAIGCFLVPAGMVYAISFGFAFQQVIESFREVEVDIEKRADRLDRILTLVNQLTCVGTATQIQMLRIVKDVALTSASMMTGQDENDCKHKLEDLDALLRVLCSTKVREAATRTDADYWQKSVFKRLEKLISDDDGLTGKLSKSRIHQLQWSFLQTLGYFTFLGVLLIDAQSYRAGLSMCIITVLSISLLCYVVADLDSPFFGVFQVNLGNFCDVIRKLSVSFEEAQSEGDVRKTSGTINENDVLDLY